MQKSSGNSLSLFRTIGYAEGISLLVLLGIAMPLKYLAGYPLAVKYTGWAHGLLFVAYLALALWAKEQEDWPFKYLIYAFFSGIFSIWNFPFRQMAEETWPSMIHSYF
jgi:integral membrane protein